jgi:uncharacterized integral membrane protein
MAAAGHMRARVADDDHGPDEGASQVPDEVRHDATAPDQVGDDGASAVGAHESRRDRSGRLARRGRLYLHALLMAALLVVVVALVGANTRTVEVSWVFGSSRQSLVWIVLATALLGWLLGIVTSVLFRHRTRAPRG